MCSPRCVYSRIKAQEILLFGKSLACEHTRTERLFLNVNFVLAVLVTTVVVTLETVSTFLLPSHTGIFYWPLVPCLGLSTGIQIFVFSYGLFTVDPLNERMPGPRRCLVLVAFLPELATVLTFFLGIRFVKWEDAVLLLFILRHETFSLLVFFFSLQHPAKDVLQTGKQHSLLLGSLSMTQFKAKAQEPLDARCSI